MLNPKAFANAITVVTAIFYVVCVALTYVAPDLIIAIGQSWMHVVDLASIKTAVAPDFGLVILGLVTISAAAWVTTYATIWLYNRWAK